MIRKYVGSVRVSHHRLTNTRLTKNGSTTFETSRQRPSY